MRYLRLALLPLVLVACADGGPLAPEVDVAPSLSVAGNSGCATVHFAATIVPTGGTTWTGTLTGDLVGTTDWVFEGDPKFAGVTWKAAPGIGQWVITDGVLGAVSFETEIDQMNLMTDRPGSPWYVIEIVGTQRALTGVEKANLHYDAVGSYQTMTIEADFTGVICP
jgi:hypothetical protein